jgi:mRNA-degrading endonuclease toxin of MazEF toxin-antitoxin module
MPIECVLALDNTFSAEKAFLTERITTLGPEKMAAVCSALATATTCR